MGNQVDLGLTIFGDASRRAVVRPQLTLDRLVRWIKAQELDDYTTQGLIEIASRYPTHALPTFRRNFAVMLSRVRAKKAKEEGPIIQSRKEIHEEDWQEIDQENQTITEGEAEGNHEQEETPGPDQGTIGGKVPDADLEGGIDSLPTGE